MIDFPVLPSGEKPIWDGKRFQLGERVTRVLAYSSNFTGWDDELTELHEVEAGDGQHPIDVASRNAALDALRRYGFPTNGAVLEIGCSSGFLLHDLRQEFPHAEIVGADIVVKPLEHLGESLPGVPLMQMDLLQCPLGDRQFDAVVALNVLEHIEDDTVALEKMARLLKPGGILVLEVPQGPNLYDYYDAYLRHFRRYRKKELLTKIITAGLELKETDFLGFVAYLPFFIVKKLNRLRFGQRGEKSFKIEEMVRKEIKATARSKTLEFVFAIEKALSGKISFPMGIRCTAISRAPMIAGAVMSLKATLIRNGKMFTENNLSPVLIHHKINADTSAKWPKRFPPLPPERQRINNDFIKYWHEVLPKRYGFVDEFNHRYPVLNSPSGFARTLEIGAGIGEHLEYEKLNTEQESNYVAVDIRENMVAEIRCRFPSVTAIVADCQQRLPFENGYFDRILAIHVLEHLPDLPAAIREVHRLCDKIRGIFSIVIPCEGSLAYTLARRFSAKRIFQKRYQQPYDWFIEREHINRAFEIFEEIAPYFDRIHATYFPIALNFEFCNLCIGATFRPNSVLS